MRGCTYAVSGRGLLYRLGIEARGMLAAEWPRAPSRLS